jgi:hypothetical protein
MAAGSSSASATAGCPTWRLRTVRRTPGVCHVCTGCTGSVITRCAFLPGVESSDATLAAAGLPVSLDEPESAEDAGCTRGATRCNTMQPGANTLRPGAPRVVEVPAECATRHAAFHAVRQLSRRSQPTRPVVLSCVRRGAQPSSTCARRSSRRPSSVCVTATARCAY